MTREFIYTSPFRKSWEMMGLNDDDLKELENILLSNPQTGSVIQGTGGARKMRIKREFDATKNLLKIPHCVRNDILHFIIVRIFFSYIELTL